MNLRDLLNARDEATTRNGRPNETVTLATILACEKHNQQSLSSISTDAAGGRTLLDIIRLDEDTRRIIANPINRRTDPVDRPQGIRWKGIKSLLRLRRIATWPNSSNPTSEVVATSPPTIVNEVGIDWPPAPPQQESEGEPIRPSLMALLEEGDGRNVGGEPPFPGTMMGMIDEEDDGNNEDDDDEVSVEIGGKGKGRTYICCVCMIRHKGAAFIPCGHTFCRLCSRELWVSRGNCPLCNCFILEILDIF